MPTVHFIAPGNMKSVATVAEGYSVMEAAVKIGVAGIAAECGGAGACGTCLVEVDERWWDRLDGVEVAEREMLEELGDEPRWRLSCQLRLSADLDGLIVRVLS